MGIEIWHKQFTRTFIWQFENTPQSNIYALTLWKFFFHFKATGWSRFLLPAQDLFSLEETFMSTTISDTSKEETNKPTWKICWSLRLSYPLPNPRATADPKLSVLVPVRPNSPACLSCPISVVTVTQAAHQCTQLRMKPKAKVSSATGLKGSWTAACTGKYCKIVVL